MIRNLFLVAALLFILFILLGVGLLGWLLLLLIL